MGTGELNAGGNPAMDQGGVEIFRVASGYGNRDKLRPDFYFTCIQYRISKEKYLVKVLLLKKISLAFFVWLQSVFRPQKLCTGLLTPGSSEPKITFHQFLLPGTEGRFLFPRAFVRWSVLEYK